MKLLRLQSEQDSLNFNGILNDNLILNKNSKIGLQSISWEKDKIIITIDNSNNNFTFEITDQTNTTFTTTALMSTVREYNFNTLDEFIIDLQNALNNSLTIDIPKHIGLILRVDESQTKNNHVEITNTQRSFIDFFVPKDTSNNNFQNVGIDNIGNNIYQKDQSLGQTYISALFGFNDGEFFSSSQGCGSFRFKIGNLSNNGRAYYIGLTNIDPTNLGGNFSFSIERITFGIEIKNTATAIDFIKRDSETGVITKTISAILPSSNTGVLDTNDVVELSLNKGKLEGRIYKHNGTAYNSDLFFSETYDKSLDVLYPIIGFHSSAVGTVNSIQQLRYTPRNFISPQGHELNDLEIVGVPPQNRDLVIYKLTFPDDEIRSFMGYDKITQTSDLTSLFIFTGQTPVSVYDESENYLVILDSLNLDSYDYSKGKSKRRNLLQLIPNIRNKGQKDVLYFTDNPIMIDLKNNDKITLNNILMRVLDSDESEVNITGLSECVLLIDNSEN